MQIVVPDVVRGNKNIFLFSVVCLDFVSIFLADCGICLAYPMVALCVCV